MPEPSPAAAPDLPPRPANPDQGGGGGCAIIFAVLIVLGIIGTIFEGCGGSDSGDGDTSVNYDASAYSACESYVEGQLKAPSTAEFAGYGES